MAVLPIRKLPDPVLRQKAKRISIIDASIKKLVRDMFDTMYDAPGAGLAGPQVGKSLRVIVLSVPECIESKEEPKKYIEYAIINPQVVRRQGERVVDEGCLSIPGYSGEIRRSLTVTVKGLDINGKEIRVKADDLLAQALEHEIDHLNGVLYIDYLESLEKLHKIQPVPAESVALSHPVLP